MTKLACAALVAALGFFAPAAQAQVGAGVNLQYGLDSEELLLGGELHLVIGAVEGLTFVPGLELYLADEPSVLVLNGNFHYAPSVSSRSSIRPYAGFGPALTRTSFGEADRTDFGVNVLGGVNFRAGSLTPFIQLKYRAGDAEDLTLGGGVRFIL